MMGLVLFLAGVALAYVVVLPLALRFFVGILSDILVASWTATDCLGFVVKMLLAFGIVFELPLVVLVLSVLGIVTPDFLRNKRRHAFVAILPLASFISPGDMINVTILMTVPLIALYEFSIFLSVLVWRKRDAGEEEADASPPNGAVAVEDGDEAGTEVTPYNHGDPAGGSAAATPDGDG